MTAASEFGKLLDLALAEAKTMTDEQMRLHKLDGLAGWSLDEARGRLLFGDPRGRYAIMAAQAIGLYDPAKQQWQWAWADQSFPAHLVQAAQHVRVWGQVNEIPLLTEPMQTIAEADAFRLTAFAARFIGWPGIYRGETKPQSIFLAFRSTLDPQGGPDRVDPIAPPTISKL